MVEVCPEALVDNIDELRQRHGLRPHEATPNFGGSIEAPGFTMLQGDRPLADLLQAVVLEPHLVIELVRRATLTTWQLRREMAEEHVQPLKI